MALPWRSPGRGTAGDWSGCHAVPWDAAGAPRAHGDRELTNRLTKGSYMFGIAVNRDGHRYIDEAADFRDYTYVLQGEAVVRQPSGVAVQVFDAQIVPLLRPADYDVPGASRAQADTLDALAAAAGIDPAGLTATVARFNAAIGDGRFDPSILDGKAT
jgi:tricarballylate dehydrogenase